MLNFQELIHSNFRTKKTCFHFLLTGCSQISQSWEGFTRIISVQLLTILMFHISLPEKRISLLSPCGGSLDSLPFLAAPWVCAGCHCFQRACVGGEAMALAKGRTLGSGCQWQSPLCRAAHGIRCSEPFCAEFIGGEGSVHHRDWRALLSGQCKACLLNRSGKLGWLLRTLSVHCN